MPPDCTIKRHKEIKDIYLSVKPTISLSIFHQGNVLPFFDLGRLF